MASPLIVTLTQENFAQQVLQSPSPVLVDFWAEWCGPCKMIAPLLDELADEYDGKVKIGKVNIDEHQSLATEYGIRAIPTLLLFNKGQVADQIVGARSKRDFKASLDRVVARSPPAARALCRLLSRPANSPSVPSCFINSPSLRPPELASFVRWSKSNAVRPPVHSASRCNACSMNLPGARRWPNHCNLSAGCPRLTSR